jgi:hypothetical protein
MLRALLCFVLLSATAAAQDANQPAPRRERGPRGFGRPIVLNANDVPAFSEPPVTPEWKQALSHFARKLFQTSES